MKIVFVHQNCPGQFKYLAVALAAIPGNQVVFITRPGKPDLPHVRKLEYTPARKPADSTHRYLRLTEEGILNAQAVANVAMQAKKAGFRPDVIVAHVGWGEALYLKQVWPDAPVLGYFEWFYRPTGSDVDFLKPPALDDMCRIQTRNSLHFMNLEMADWGITPTRWQWRQHPAAYRDKISILHDGVDTERVKPNPQATGSLKSGLRLKAGDEVITYVARNLEPYRGFPSFMRAAALIQQRHPNAHIVVVGGDGVSYGAKPADGSSYRAQMLAELGDALDLNRIHFLGKVKYDIFLRLLQLSAAHVYLSVPFVLSWSMLEAMAAGCLVIGSRTAPVEEVIKDGKNGLLADFFSPEEIAEQVDRVLSHPDRMAALRRAARQTVLDHYALKTCLSKQIQLIHQVARGNLRDTATGNAIVLPGRKRIPPRGPGVTKAFRQTQPVLKG
jgi:glycosyltransferase involved in cell wall biosynthesis